MRDVENLLQDDNSGLTEPDDPSKLESRKVVVEHEIAERSVAGGRWRSASPESSCTGTGCSKSEGFDRTKAPSSLPFSLDQVLRHFNEAFGRQPFRIDEWTNEHAARI